MLVGTAWWKDASKDRLDIGKAISILRLAVEVGQAWQAPKLVRAAYVAMSVIHDEYSNAPDAALSILDEAEEDGGKNDARLLNQRAKVLLRLSRVLKHWSFLNERLSLGHCQILSKCLLRALVVLQQLGPEIGLEQNTFF